METLAGLHHVTAIVADAQRTLDFYTEIVGLRLVKRTVNFDDPGSYHLYFGDEAGSPGTILTFFAWPGARRGTAGVGETAAVAFRAPVASLPFWEQHLRGAGLPVESTDVFGDDVLRFADPDGMVLEIVGAGEARVDSPPAWAAPIPHEHALGGFWGVTLAEGAAQATADLLAAMGFAHAGTDGSRTRLLAPGDAPGRVIDLLVTPGQQRGRTGAGTVHHIAFRNVDDASQAEWQARLGALGMEVTPVMDRTYFHSVYFREPGGVLFELATDPPGFALDEPLAQLGESLKLPAWLEPRRAEIERHLPPLALRQAREVGR